MKKCLKNNFIYIDYYYIIFSYIMLSSFDFDLVIHLFIMSIVLLFIYFCYLFTLL